MLCQWQSKAGVHWISACRTCTCSGLPEDCVRMPTPVWEVWPGSSVSLAEMLWGDASSAGTPPIHGNRVAFLLQLPPWGDKPEFRRPVTPVPTRGGGRKSPECSWLQGRMPAQTQGQVCLNSRSKMRPFLMCPCSSMGEKTCFMLFLQKNLNEGREVFTGLFLLPKRTAKTSKH